jgi:broad specificity phosphatase PhoE
MPLELLLIRHGQSEANAGWSADPDCALTPLGWEQSRAAGRQLAGIGVGDFVALVSPYRRTRETAEAISTICGLHFGIDERVREWGERATVEGKEYAHEPIEDVVLRLQTFLAEPPGRKLVIVSHATPIALLAQLARGEPPTTTGAFWEGVRNGSVLRVTGA